MSRAEICLSGSFMKRKVLLLEINEITWNLIDPFIEAGKLPTFAKLKKEGTWAAPMSVDLPPQLDPWITWTTVYTGRTQAEQCFHFSSRPKPQATDLGNLPRAGCASAYSAVSVRSAAEVEGFYVPDTFSPDAATFPRSSARFKIKFDLHALDSLENDETSGIRLNSEGFAAARLRLSTCTEFAPAANEKSRPTNAGKELFCSRR